MPIRNSEVISLRFEYATDGRFRYAVGVCADLQIRGSTSGGSTWVDMTGNDPYSRSGDHYRHPPRGFRDTLRHLGPGMILVGSVVGSGELIVTTKLGPWPASACCGSCCFRASSRS